MQCNGTQYDDIEREWLQDHSLVFVPGPSFGSDDSTWRAKVHGGEKFLVLLYR